MEGVTREFFRSRSSSPVRDASDFTLSTIGPIKKLVSMLEVASEASGFLFTLGNNIADA